ncbi:3074_t:CDS:2 [Acaulospora morrowiae]|uniref:3074_t:CDS:1 n=1 Tax=Acaulospora morrowiae TaxID=94023 RepID=A0A9N8WAH8_9GLOM|nr:3074_t:CDS:2 [Acaulospora morrowiae]
MVALNRDCFWQIFNNLEQDKKSLHSSILVNRAWCEIAIQFLWKKPFRFLYTCSKSCNCTDEERHEKARNLLSTFITCMAHNQTSTSIDMQDFVVWTTAPPTTFNYLSFLRHVDLHDLFLALTDGVKHLRTKKDLNFVMANQHNTSTLKKGDNWESAVIQEMARDICKLLVLHCSNMRNISIDMANRKWSSDNYRCSSIPNISFWVTFREIPDELLLIPTYRGASNCLSQLVEFYWGATHWTSEFLVALSKVSRRLKKIVIDMSNFGRSESSEHARNMGKLIKVQTALQDIQFIKCKPRVLPAIMEGLRSQEKTLHRFYFQGMVKDWSVFSELVHLTNLQEMSFVQANFRCSEVEMLSTSHFPKLTKLVFNVAWFRFPIIIPEIIIKNSGKRITTFSLPQYYYPSCDGFVPTVALSVAKHCPNLVHFEYFAKKNEFPQLVLLFASCPQLKKVMISGCDEDANDLLIQIANHELPNLSEFEIAAQWTFSPSSLETFFVKSKAPLKSFVVSLSPCFADEHTNVILRCFGDRLTRLHVETSREISEKMLAKANKHIPDFVYKMIEEIFEPGFLDNSVPIFRMKKEL